MCLTLVLNLSKSVRNKRIARKHSEYGTREYHIEKPTFEWESTLPYLGKNIALRVRNNSVKHNKFELTDGQFQASIYGNPSPARIRRLYEKWLFN